MKRWSKSSKILHRVLGEKSNSIWEIPRKALKNQILREVSLSKVIDPQDRNDQSKVSSQTFPNIAEAQVSLKETSLTGHPLRLLTRQREFIQLVRRDDDPSVLDEKLRRKFWFQSNTTFLYLFQRKIIRKFPTKTMILKSILLKLPHPTLLKCLLKPQFLK